MTYIIVIILVILSGIFSGLTLGFFSLNKDDLKRKAELGNQQAIKVYAIRKQGNLLLCTLLIGNVAVNSTLSIFLGSITSGWIAGLIATSLIVIFGEIAPQATFSRFALTLGSKLAWLVRIFIFILFPVCWPLAWILDKALGAEVPNIYSKKELMKIVEEHEDLKQSDIDEDEERIIKGALSYSNKTVSDVMTPRTEMYTLAHDTKLTKKILKEIHDKGHSRIPIYKNDQESIVGILFSKDLINYEANGKTVSSIMRKNVLFVDSEKNLDEVLNAFGKTKNHLFIVLDEFGGVEGLITIEDVLEEIIGREIIDEFDHHEDLQREAKKKLSKKNIQKV